MSTEPGPSAPVLEARALVAGYVPEVDIVRGCDLVVGPGELVGVIGPNGAGKSTLLKALVGLVPVRDGEVVLRGEPVTSLPAHERVARGIGYVPQTDHVFRTLTVAENLRMGAYLHPDTVPAGTERLSRLLPTVAERASQRVGSLSGGEQQVVAMARALMADPAVLLLDEPSASLSPAAQDHVFELIATVNAEGISIVMVEQNARRCLEVAHRAYVLDQGANAYEGPGRQLLDDPRVVELYLGSLGKR